MNMPYTPQAEKRLKHLFNLLGLRIIPCYFHKKNPELYEQWQYNACNQTALITAYVLTKLLVHRGLHDSNPWGSTKFDINIYEGIFTEDYAGQYNHAFLYAKEQTGATPMCFFIDVGRVSNPTVFKMGPCLSPFPVAYSDAYQNHTIQQLDLTAMLYNQAEYYTSKKGLEICIDIDVILRKLGFDLTNFDWKA